jgi:hypothetical protein
MQAASKRTILRIELWHLILLSGLFITLGWTKIIEPYALLAGGLFMGINFFLLSYGVASVLTPLADKGRVKAGVGLLVLKIVIFLGLLTTLFFRFDINPISFSLGFSSLLLAIVVEAVRTSVTLRM